MENFQDRGVWIRIRFVQRGWIRIRSISDRIRNPGGSVQISIVREIEKIAGLILYQKQYKVTAVS